MRKLIALAIAACFAIVAAPGADAGVPPPPDKPDGTVNAANREYKWSAGPFVSLNPSNFLPDGEPCTDGLEAMTCDYEYVHVEVPASGASVEFGIESPGATPADDMDLYIYDAKGKYVGESVNDTGEPGVPEKVKLRLSKSGVYIVEVAMWSTLGASYEGKVKLV